MTLTCSIPHVGVTMIFKQNQSLIQTVLTSYVRGACVIPTSVCSVPDVSSSRLHRVTEWLCSTNALISSSSLLPIDVGAYFFTHRRSSRSAFCFIKYPHTHLSFFVEQSLPLLNSINPETTFLHYCGVTALIIVRLPRRPSFVYCSRFADHVSGDSISTPSFTINHVFQRFTTGAASGPL